MPPKSPTDVLFDKHDAVVRAIGKMERSHAVTVSQVERLDKDFQQLQSEGAQRHGEIIATLSDMKKVIAELSGKHQYLKGAKEAQKFIIPSLIGIIGLLITAMGTYMALIRLTGG